MTEKRDADFKVKAAAAVMPAIHKTNSKRPTAEGVFVPTAMPKSLIALKAPEWDRAAPSFWAAFAKDAGSCPNSFIQDKNGRKRTA